MRRGSFFVALLTLAACGGGEQPPAKTTADAPKPAAVDNKVGARRLGHYSSGDGMFGVVIDRSGDKPKIKIDGTKDVIELAVEKHEDRRSADADRYDLYGPDGKLWMKLGADGSVEFLRDGRTLSLSRDADAPLLGAATQIGKTPVKEPSPYDQMTAALEPTLIMKKFPQFKPQDSSNLAKVAEAMALADATMFVRYRSRGHYNPHYQPAAMHIDDVFHSDSGFGGYPTDEPWDKKKAGVLKWGGVLIGETGVAPNWVDGQHFGRDNTVAPKNRIRLIDHPAHNIRMREAKGWPDPLADGTPGILWESADGYIFVTLDGGRYRLVAFGGDAEKGYPFEAGLGKSSEWPAPMQHVLLDDHSLSYLHKGGGSTSAGAADLSAAQEDYRTCGTKVWEAARPDFVKLTRQAKSTHAETLALRDKTFDKVATTCAKPLQKYEDVLVREIEARNKERLALFDKAKARAKALGVP